MNDEDNWRSRYQPSRRASLIGTDRPIRKSEGTQRTSSVEPLTLPKRDHSGPTNHVADGDGGMLAASTAAAANMSPLGQPDAMAFSTPGTLVENENEGGQSGSAAAASTADTGNGLVVCVVPNADPGGAQKPSSNAAVVAGAPYEATTAMQSPPSPTSANPVPPPPQPPRRSQSALSNRSDAPSITSAYDICRICHCEGASDAPLISPCCCSGSLKYVHQKCLQQWIKSSQTRSCEVCRFTFIMETKVKPFRKWEKLDISSVERRKILCSVTFHVVAITCVVWSLYVLIDRTAEEIRAGSLDWPFWTKLVVVAIGFTGGLVFMYVQCKMYVQLFRRWQSYNKVIYVQNGPAGGSGGGISLGGGKYVASSNGDGNGLALNK